MVLPNDLLDKVSYYEVSTAGGHCDFHTVINLHFKSWWRLTKTIQIAWLASKAANGDISFIESAGSVAVKEQLAQYFTNKNG